ncbi:TetR/AcrR family transcriptional regulator [Streptomyces fuscichromogenes]|uniref:TetR/AcrR family transcriptional regulator n=1 Tax=Streptomyces fuscichromogenes TaxID=1324013 RepID=UPI003803605E
MRAQKTGRPPATTREEILQVARGLFKEQGYTKTSLEMVARSAGIARTSLFAYFPAKSDLIWAPYEPVTACLADGLAHWPTDGSIVNSVAAAFRAALDESTIPRDVVIDIWTIVEQSPELRALSAAGMQAGERIVAEAIAKQVDTTCDAFVPEVLACALVSAATAATTHWVRSCPTAPLVDIVDRAIRPILSGYAPLLVLRRQSGHV